MAKQSKHIQPSHEQLRRYAAGELSSVEQHRVEKAALQNRQTDDILEGLLALQKEHIDEEAALKDLHRRLQQRVQKNERRLIPFYYAGAAAVVLTVGLGWWLTQKEELTKKVSSTPALQRAAPVIRFESAPGSADGQPSRTVPTLAEVPKPLAGKPEIPEPEVGAAPAEAGQQLPAEPLPTVALEEKKDNIPTPATTSEPLQSSDSGQNTAAPAVKTERMAMVAAPSSAVSKRSAFGAVNKKDIFTIRGKVLTDHQEVLPGVVLQLKDQRSGVSTDAQGNFVLPNVHKGDEITVTSVGFEKKQITVNDSVIGPIVLKEDAQALSEVVVTGKQDNLTLPNRKISPENGWKKYRSYLKNAAKAYINQNPQAPRGEVRLAFVITSAGELIDFKAINKADATLFEEAIRIIKNGEAWEPGIRNGQRVSDKIMLRIHFK